MTGESHIHDLLGVRRRSSNMQSDQQQDSQQDNQQDDRQQQQQQPGQDVTTTDSSSQLTSTAGDVTESRDDDVIADRRCAAGLGVEVCRFTPLSHKSP